jgi:hypothetical protein
MKEHQIIKICFIITFIGIVFALFFWSTEFKTTTISDLLLEEGKKGIVYGKIKYIINTNPTIFNLENEITTKVFFNKNLDLDVGTNVKVYATSQKYKNEMELIAHKVEAI